MSSHLRPLVAIAALLASLVLLSTEAGAQAAADTSVHVAAGVSPDTVTVGQPFRSLARVTVPAGATLSARVASPDSDAYQLTDSVAVQPLDSARTRWSVGIPLVAWRADSLPLPPATVKLAVTRADGSSLAVGYGLALPAVRSVLPADTAGLRPKPAKDVLDDERAVSYTLLIAAIALAALLLILLVAYLVRRFLRRRREGETETDARAAALAALDRARAAGFVERGDWKGFYTGVSEALRGFAASLRPDDWGADLTTAELVEQMTEDGAAPDDVRTLHGVLSTADLAKFARHPVTPSQATADLDAARAWVQGFHPPAPPPSADANADADADARETAGVAR